MTHPLADRRIVFGVCGGIAAYKAVEVCRRLVDAGAHVMPVMTQEATRFVGPVTLSAVASEKVQTSLWDEADPIPHTRLGRSADLVVVAPATANLIARYAGGFADDLLTATLLATRARVVLCPAMHTEMWHHPAVAHNVTTLRSRGVTFVGPATGQLAGGDHGAGRLAEPQDIVAAVLAAFAPQQLAGCKVLVTAGGTREPLDAVRYLGNRSSGKQGYALAAEAVARGAQVTLVSAVDQPAPAGVDAIGVETADDMAKAVLGRAHTADVVIMAAAVADFRPARAPVTKMAKADGPPEVLLVPTVDILAELGRHKQPGQTLVGFAAETDAGELEARATAKLTAKNLDLIVANDVSSSDAGFGTDNNRATLIAVDGETTQVPLVDKRELARLVLDDIARLRANTSGRNE